MEMGMEALAVAAESHDFRSIDSAISIGIHEIRKDGGTQARQALDPAVIREYAALMAAETKFPPLTVWFDGSSYWLSDGFHRLEAAKRVGFKYVTAYVLHGTLEDAIWDSFGTNSVHGLRRRRSDLVVVISRALKHPNSASLSNVEIAKHLGIPEATLRRWRKRLSSQVDEDSFRTVQRKDTRYILRIGRIGKRSRPDGSTPGIKIEKSLTQLQLELTEMKSNTSPEVTRMLEAIGKWLFDGQQPAECLAVIEKSLAAGLGPRGTNGSKAQTAR